MTAGYWRLPSKSQFPKGLVGQKGTLLLSKALETFSENKRALTDLLPLTAGSKSYREHSSEMLAQYRGSVVPLLLSTLKGYLGISRLFVLSTDI